MMQDLHVVSAPVETLGYTILAQAEKTGPQGPDFGKASPVGLFVIVALLVAVLSIGVLFNRRMKNMTRRREYAEKHGMDPFDIEAIDAAMAQNEHLREAEVGEQAWPLAEPAELAAAYGDGESGTETIEDADAGTADDVNARAGDTGGGVDADVDTGEIDTEADAAEDAEDAEAADDEEPEGGRR